MKRIITFIAVVFILAFIVKLLFGERRNDPNAGERKALAEQIIQAEPKVVDAVVTDAGVLYAAVVDDGTRRDGLAGYLCESLSGNKLVNRVKIVKAGSTKDPQRDNAYGILLGESWCK